MKSAAAAFAAAAAILSSAFAAPAATPETQTLAKRELPYPLADFEDCIGNYGPVQANLVGQGYPGHAINCHWFHPNVGKEVGNDKIEVWVDNYQARIFEDAWECWNNGKQGLLDQLKSEAGPDKPGHVTHIHWQGPYACKLEFWWS